MRADPADADGSVPRALSPPSPPAGDNLDQVGEPLDDGVGLALGGAALPVRDVAVWEQHGAHPDRLRPEDVVERPVTDEYRFRRIVDIDRVQRGAEGLRVWLGPLDLGAVDGAVDQCQHFIAREDPVMVLAGPQRVGQHADAEPPLAQLGEEGLGVPLGVFLVRKLGAPGRDELAMGAIASGGVVVLNEHVVPGLDVGPLVLQRVAEEEARELLRRERAYRDERPAPDLQGRTAILVDDGLATGASMRAAVQALRQLRPGRIVVAVPAAPASTCRELAAEVDEVVSATTPSPF